jgi:hypothetical protein
MLRLRKKQLIALATMGSVSVVLGVTIAPEMSSATGLLHTGNTPSLIGSQMTVAVTAATEAGDPLALWTGTRSDGALCADIRTGQAASTPVATATDVAGGWCELPPVVVQKTPLTANLFWSADPDGGFQIVLAGQTSPDVSAVELQSPAGTTSVPTHGGYFITSLPNAGTTGKLPAGDFSLTAQSSSGSTVGILDLNQLLADAQPK